MYTYVHTHKYLKVFHSFTILQYILKYTHSLPIGTCVVDVHIKILWLQVQTMHIQCTCTYCTCINTNVLWPGKWYHTEIYFTSAISSNTKPAWELCATPPTSPAISMHSSNEARSWTDSAYNSGRWRNTFRTSYNESICTYLCWP